MAKGRSPNYPSLNIREAVERVKRVYEKEHLHQAPKEVVAEDLGYKSLNGSSLTLIGAMKRYGLLEGSGDALRVTKDAVTLIELNATEQAYRDTLSKAAFLPELFSELRVELGSTLPSESTLRHKLINKGFMSKAADDIIRVYRENIEIVALESGQYNRQDEDELAQNNASRLSAMSGPSGPTGPTGPTGGSGFPSVVRASVGAAGTSAAASAAMNHDVFTLVEGSVVIQWPKSLSQASYQDFEDWLELIKRKAKRAVAPEAPDKKRFDLGDLDQYTGKQAE